MTAWLSVDTDDTIHLPSRRGHPHRSAQSMPTWRTEGYRASPRLLNATDRFIEWVADGPKVTLFLIAEQLDCPEFTKRLDVLLTMPNILIACHGWGHRCWSAWPEDTAGFSEMLIEARDRISAYAESSWRPWFRAPGGYVAPWMAGPLAAAGFRLDSSVNPSRWVNRKMGGDWTRVKDAMEESGVVERPWLTTRMGPACGPALSLFPFSLFAKQAWKRNSVSITDEPEITASTALYWHLLDHERKQGKWTPPLANEIECVG
jgi:peptidoglycan/xylan/chitin deacetylase (PgdA/CDA1 family)